MPRNPGNPSKYALKGRIVTMDRAFTLLDPGVIYVDDVQIAAVQAESQAAPAGFEAVPIWDTGGTIYPGLIELHNHLSYNILQLLNLPQPFKNRDEWRTASFYIQQVSQPMQVLANSPDIPEAIVRYVEAKCFLSGVTTSQGISLSSNSQIQHYYRGYVRNVESSNDSLLPSAQPRISDIPSGGADAFMAELKALAEHNSTMILHLAEGVDDTAHKYFLNLQTTSGEWAITKRLAGIHCLALKEADFKIMQTTGGAVVWSPLSNLLLYSGLADLGSAKALGLRIALGSDWSPTGSKNLLGELKIAYLVNLEQLHGLFSSQELVAMVTSTPAQIVGWDNNLGSLEAGKRADLLVVATTATDPYEGLIKAHETHIGLVVIDGEPLYGTKELLANHFRQVTEEWQVGGQPRCLNLSQANADPIVSQLSLKAAKERLENAMSQLPQLAQDLASPPPVKPSGQLEGDSHEFVRKLEVPQWHLNLDMDELNDPLLPEIEQTFSERTAIPEFGSALHQLDWAAISREIVPLSLDALTVADDTTYLTRLSAQANLPEYIKTKLPELY